MSRLEQYANWLVENQDKQDSEEFQTVAAAYRELRTGSALPEAATGKASTENPAGLNGEDVVRGLFQGATFGFSDEISAMAKAGIGALTTGADYSSLYEDNLKYERDALAEFHKNNPVAAMATEIVGSMITGGFIGAKTGVGRALAQRAATASLAGKVGLGAAAGVTGGATYGAGTAEEGERLQGAATGAAFGAAGGAVGGAAAVGLSKAKTAFDQSRAVTMANVVSKRAAKKMQELGINRQEAVRRALEETGNQPEPYFHQLHKMGHSGKSAVDVSTEYWKNPAYVDRAAEYFRKNVVESKYVAKPMEWFDNTLGRSLATSLEKIHPMLSNNLRRMEMYKHIMIGENSTKASLWRQGYKAMKEADRIDVDLALMSGDRATARDIMAKYSTSPQVNDAIRKVASRARIDDAGTLLEEFDGRIAPMLEDYNNMLKLSKTRGAKDTYTELPEYFPRVLMDEEGFKQSPWGIALRKQGFLDVVKQKSRELKRPLTIAEQDDIMLKMLTKPEVKPMAPKSRHELRRQIPKMDRDLAKFYMSADDALEAYIHNTSEVISHRQFLGMTAAGSKYKEAASTVDGVNMMLNDMVSSKTLTMDEAEKAMALIQSRMGNGAVNMAKMLQQTKNWFYASTIANPVSTVTQFGDTALSGVLNGIGNTLKSGLQVGRHMNRLPQLDASDMFDLVRHQEELITTNGFNKWLTRAFKWSGFTSVDKFGKNVNIQSTLNKAAKLAANRADDVTALRKEFGNSLFTDDEWIDVADALRRGEVTENIKFMVWNRLSDAQPISLSEMPKAYLDHPNGRIWYAMKSYALKQLDLVRKRGVDLLAQPGRRLEGAKFLSTYAALLGSANLTTDQIKNWMQFRDDDFTEYTTSQMAWAAFRGLGLSEYWADQMSKPGDARKNAALGMLIPGAFQNMWDTVIQPYDLAVKALDEDKEVEVKDWKFLRKIPGAGPFLYNYIGGNEVWEEWQEKKQDEKWDKD